VIRDIKKKIISVILFSAIVLCSGCEKDATIINQEEVVDISFSWWGNDDRNEYTLSAIQHFEDLHPNIKVTCNYSEWTGYETRYNVGMISNTESDVMQINYSWLTEYSADGDGYYDLNRISDLISLDNFSEEDLEYGTMNGKLNAIPIALNSMSIYINTSVYSSYGLDVPVTWDDYFNAAKVMKGKAYPLAAASKSAMFLIIAYVEQQTGKTFMDMDGNINFNVDDVQMMLEFYKKLVDEGVMPQVEYYDKNSITSGEYAGFMGWISDASNYSDEAIANGYKFTAADYPGVNDYTEGGWYVKPATMYAISANTEHPEEAAMLLEYLLNDTDMAEYQGIEKGIPLSSSARTYLDSTNQLTGLQYDAYTVMNDNKGELQLISPYLENTNILSAFQSACNDVFYGEVTAEKRAATLLKEMKDIIASEK
jgi:oligogalacturonide transport system substrate-binding protein